MMWVIIFLISTILSDNLSVGEIIDLSWGFNNETVYWTGQRKFVFTKQLASDSSGYWYAANEFCAAEHGGTHFDAPYHFNKNGWKISEVPVERLYAKGAVVKVEDDNENNNITARLRVEHLENWERRNGPFEKGSVLLVNFGRSSYWETNKTKYIEMDTNNQMNFPGISVEAANWMAKSGKFYGAGLDTPSIDPGISSDLKVHKIFAASHMYNLENVKLLADLPERGFHLIIAPMKIDEGTGAPVRIFAQIN